jgi:translation initiation factor 2D
MVTASTPVDIKHSAFNSLTAFLRASAKEGLIKIEETARKRSVVVTGTSSFVSSKD